MPRKNLQVAVNAFDEIMQNIGDRGIEADAEFLGEVTDTTSPNVTPEDAKLLQSLLGFFDDLAANNSAELLAESAVAARRAGDIYLRLGQLRQADRAYSDALQRYRRLSSQKLRQPSVDHRPSRDHERIGRDQRSPRRTWPCGPNISSNSNFVAKPPQRRWLRRLVSLSTPGRCDCLLRLALEPGSMESWVPNLTVVHSGGRLPR